MRLNRRFVAIGVAVVALAAGGVGIAYAVGGDSEEQVTGPNADKAKRAALDAVGGGKVLEVEGQDDDGAGAYEVEVERPDGSQVEVHIGSDFQPVGSTADDDTGSESGDDEGPGDDDGPGDDE
jgi:hypothetical protein